MKFPAIYIISNLNRSTLYIGVTSDIERRMLEHKAGVGSAFAAKYHLYDLLYCEKSSSMKDAIAREKQLKNWHKDWKWNLIKTGNPSLRDLASDWFTADEVIAFREDWKAERKNAE